MSVRATIDLIQTANRQIAGTRTVPTFAQYPLTADTVRLPMVLTWPDQATWTRQQFGGKKREDRVYVIMVFVQPIGQGEMPARSAEAVVLLDAFRDFWLSLDGNGYPTALADMSPQVTVMWDGEYPQDSGVGALPPLKVGGTQYTGFEIRLKVRELT
jgi:hypothetical protein